MLFYFLIWKVKYLYLIKKHHKPANTKHLYNILYNVFDVGPTLHKCYINVLCLLGKVWSRVNLTYLKLCVAVETKNTVAQRIQQFLLRIKCLFTVVKLLPYRLLKCHSDTVYHSVIYFCVGWHSCYFQFYISCFLVNIMLVMLSFIRIL